MRLRTFGGLTILGDGDAAVDHRIQRRQLALFAVLAAAGSAGVTRDQLLGLFWAEADDERARHALGQLLYAARRVAGADAIVAGPTSLVLDASVLPSDVADFSRALERGDLEVAVAAYRGPFLQGVYLSDAPEFERWAEERRPYFADEFVGALTRLASAATAAGDHSGAVVYLRRAAATAPLSGKVAHALILALARAGDVTAALDAGRVHAALVREQLESEPDPAVLKLLAEARAGTVGPPTVPSRDRQTSDPARAGDLVTPTQVRDDTQSRPRPFQPRLGMRGAGVLGLATVAMVSLGISLTARNSARRPHTILLDRQQLTLTGRSFGPVISADGKELLYAVPECTSDACSYSLEMRNLDGTAPRSILSGGAQAWGLELSPDRRNLLTWAVIGGRTGLYLISLSGGAPRFVDWSHAAFSADGDSLLLWPEAGNDSVFFLRVATLDGVVRDSIRVRGPGTGVRDAVALPASGLPVDEPGRGTGIVSARAVPGSDLLAILFGKDDTIGQELGLVDRHGREHDRVPFPNGAFFIQPSADALWAMVRLPWRDEETYRIVRIPLDTRSGRFGQLWDTVHAGNVNVVGAPHPTADGGTLVFGEGTEDRRVWALELADALRGRRPEASMRMSSSGETGAGISPDGRRILIFRAIATPAGRSKYQWSAMPFGGGTEVPLAFAFTQASVSWVDSVTVIFLTDIGSRTELLRTDLRTGAVLSRHTVPDSALVDFTWLGGGDWAWIPAGGQRIELTQAGVRRALPRPIWFARLDQINNTMSGARVFLTGFNVAQDSQQVGVISPIDGTYIPWVTTRHDGEYFDFHLDGTLLWHKEDTLYHVFDAGHVRRIGVVPTHAGRFVWVTVSDHFVRAVEQTSESRMDAWRYRVARP